MVAVYKFATFSQSFSTSQLLLSLLRKTRSNIPRRRRNVLAPILRPRTARRVPPRSPTHHLGTSVASSSTAISRSILHLSLPFTARVHPHASTVTPAADLQRPVRFVSRATISIYRGAYHNHTETFSAPLISREPLPPLGEPLYTLRGGVSTLSRPSRQRASVCRALLTVAHSNSNTPEDTQTRARARARTHTRTGVRSRDGRGCTDDEAVYIHRNGDRQLSTTKEVYAPSEGCTRRRRSWRWRRRWRWWRRRRDAARTISHGERSYRFWPAAPADRYSRLR